MKFMRGMNCMMAPQCHVLLYRLRLGPPELKGEWQKGGASNPDLDLYLADQPR